MKSIMIWRFVVCFNPSKEDSKDSSLWKWIRMGASFNPSKEDSKEVVPFTFPVLAPIVSIPLRKIQKAARYILRLARSGFNPSKEDSKEPIVVHCYCFVLVFQSL